MRGEAKTERINVRVTASDYERLTAKARRDNRDISDWVRVLILEALDRDHSPREKKPPAVEILGDWFLSLPFDVREILGSLGESLRSHGIADPPRLLRKAVDSSAPSRRKGKAAQKKGVSKTS